MKLLLALLLLAPVTVLAQQNGQLQPDPGLLNEINQIKAIDNHSHPPALTVDGKADADFDALPCDPLEPTANGLMFREDNPVYIKAWQTMFGYKYNDMAPEHVKELLAAKAAVKQREGENYPNWVLDQLGIETELANRVALGRGHRRAALSLGAVRRHSAVPAGQFLAGSAVPRPQDLLRSRRSDAAALPEAAWPEGAASNSGRSTPRRW